MTSVTLVLRSRLIHSHPSYPPPPPPEGALRAAGGSEGVNDVKDRKTDGETEGAGTVILLPFSLLLLISERE